MKYLLKALVLTVIAGSIVACSPARQYADLPKEVADYTREVYQIGVGDQISVQVWRNDDLSVTVPVRPDGKISSPLVGDVFAAGKSAPELAKEIEAILTNYIRTPKVTVIITNANSTEFINRVRVTGAVGSPMSMPFRKGMTVLDLVLLSGGLSEFADGNNTVLYRLTSDGIETHKVYVEDILKKGDVRSNYTLMPSDIVTVPEQLF